MNVVKAGLVGIAAAVTLCSPVAAAPLASAGPAKTQAPRVCGMVRQHYAQYPKPLGFTKSGRPLVPGNIRSGMEKGWNLQLAIASAPLCH